MAVDPPTPADIRAAREAAGHTQAQAAALVHLGAQPRWAEHETGRTDIDPARWELYLLLTDQHPAYRLEDR